MKTKDKNKKRQAKAWTFNGFILCSIKWLAGILKLKYKDTTIALRIADKILNVINTRGKPEGVKYTKDLRLKFSKVILSMDPENFKRGEQLWLPKSLIPSIKRIQEVKSYPLIRLIFSVLYITRSIKVDGDISFDTIEKGPGFTGNPLSLDEDIKSFLKDIGVNLSHIGKIPKTLRFKEFHMTSKSGPNGHALWTSFRDIAALNDIQLWAIKLVAGEKLVNLMSKFSGLYSQIPQFFDNYTNRKARLTSRRIAKIKDKEGKIREVAIGDYYTQAALLPLHKYLYKFLNKIHQDCTSNQTKHFNTLENSIGSNYHSIDLKAFTDRFPIAINHRILSVWFGPEYAGAWKELMVGTPFDYNGRSINYATGNPMGLYSSFNSSALAHHFIMWLACKQVNLRWKRSRYMLLGDDIVIANDRLAEAYKQILAVWDVEIQHSKTHVSPYGFEFAKQIRLHGKNVSPFPLSALYERRNQVINTLGIIVNEVDYKSWDCNLMETLEDYYIKVLGWARPRFMSFRPTLHLVIAFLKYLQGTDPIGDRIAKAIHDFVRTLLPVGTKIKWKNKAHRRLFLHWVCVQVVQSLYIESRDRIVNVNKTKGSLGDLATEMVMAITSLRDGGADCFDLIEAVPFLQIYGRAEELYLKSFDALYDFGMGSEPKKLREHIGKVDIPLSDEGFYVRNRDVLVIQAMKASKIITQLLRTTKEVSAYNGQLRFSVPWADALSPKE